MNKKILAILAIFVVAIGIGAVSALDLGSLMGDSSSSQPENVTIDGIDFTIPAGFEEDPNLALDGVENETSGIKYTTWGKTYESNDGDIISIGVATYDGAEVDDNIVQYVGGDKLSINGVDGYDYNAEPFKGFTYAKNGKLVIISTTDESLLEQVVVG